MDKDLLIGSNINTVCQCKVTALHYYINVDGKTNADAAWRYPNPLSQASNIKAYVAYWKGVLVVESDCLK